MRIKTMGKGILIVLLLLLLSAPAILAEERLRLSTTTSTENSGLLDVLLPPFEKQFNVKVDVISVGSGKAVKLGENGDVDVVLVHERELEDKFVADGYGVNRRDVMHNDFVIIGPNADPAGIGKAKTAAEAFKLIAHKRAPFVSRGDQSGTHSKELSLWVKARVRPSGRWYIETGMGMGEVLIMAHEKGAYTLTDKGTYLAFQKEGKINLPILFEGDPTLFNPYGIIAVNPARQPHVNYILAMALIGWVTSQEGQRIIADFGKGKYGVPLFYPDAIKSPR
ncbi:MAG: tungsten ABC transporter substrate-binding protein [Deltaproteobacteria bacterium RBG_13_52_11]|nr:MAG: tungsten ABC transporter substrate-binding protein [Deltaproteobacteria bacterium RBG_13_52_11]